MENRWLCSYCYRPIITCVIWDHGKRYHNECYAAFTREQAHKEKTESAKTPPRRSDGECLDD
jgi:hypothetical protein